MSWKDSSSIVIGVVGDVRYRGLDADAGNELHLPEGLYPQAAITLLVRTDRDPSRLYPHMRRRIEEIDRDAFVFDVKPMTELARRTVEIGIRIAIGASPARVTGLMLRYGLSPVIGCGQNRTGRPTVGWLMTVRGV